MSNGNVKKSNRGHPTKLRGWLVAFERVVNMGFNAIYLTDDELRILTNELVEDKYKVADRTFESWKSGELKDPIIGDFLRLYKRAMICQKISLFEKLERDDDKWQKYAWIIERKFDEWNIRTKQESTVRIIPPIFGDE